MSTAYIELMTRHWVNALGLTPSEPLRQGWSQLEVASNDTSAGQVPWQVLQLPTGSGKTEALKALCACYSGERDSGILVVTKFKAAADDLAAGINDLAGRDVAIAQHSGSSVTAAEASIAPVLIITHSAYKSALSEAASGEISPQLDRYMQYFQTVRNRLIIDEAFEWVESFKVDLSELLALCGALSGIPRLASNAALLGLVQFANQILELANSGSSDKPLNTELVTKLAHLDIAELKAVVRRLSKGELAIWDTVDRPGNALRKAYMSILKTLQIIQSTNAGWLSNRGNHCQLNGSRVLIGAARSSGVILDATAAVDVHYQLLGSRVQLLPRPLGIRSYRNVTLNVSSGHRVGKQHLSKHANDTWPLLRTALNESLSAQAKVLVCCHKDAEDDISLKEFNCSVITKAHWGDLDGKNCWNDYDVGVIFGLPILDDIAPTNAVLACQPHLAAEWFNGSRVFGNHLDIGQAFKDGFVAKSVVQAVNRIRCRRPIDGSGDCMPTELFMLLGNGRTGAAVVSAIQSQMPGIQFRERNIATASRPQRRVPSDDSLLSLLSRAPLGILLKSSVIDRLGFSDRTFERVSRRLQQPSALLQEMTSMGVRYHCSIGRGKEAYFMKS